MKRQRLISALLAVTMISNVLFSSPLTKVMADTNGGSGSGELEVDKVISWNPEKPNEATVTITSNIIEGNETEVLFLGTLCSKHGMGTGTPTNNTIISSINAIGRNANVDYYLFGQDLAASNANIAASGSIKRDEVVDENITIIEGSNHSASQGFAYVLTDLLDEKSPNYKHYDYVVMEFDSSRLAKWPDKDKPSTGLGADVWDDENQMTAVAKLLKPYYDDDKVIWITDGADVNYYKNKSERFSAPPTYGVSPYTPTNFFYIDGDLQTCLLTRIEFKGLCSLLAPSYYLDNKEDPSKFGDEAVDAGKSYKNTDRIWHVGEGNHSNYVITLDPDEYQLKLGERTKEDKINGDAAHNYMVYSNDSRQLYYNKADELADFLYMAIQGTTVNFSDTIHVSDKDTIKVTNVDVYVTTDKNKNTDNWMTKASLNVKSAVNNGKTVTGTDGIKYVEDENGEIHVVIANTGANAAKNNDVSISLKDLKRKLQYIKVVIQVEDSNGFESCIYMKADENGNLLDENGELLNPGEDPVYEMNPNNGDVTVDAYKNGDTVSTEAHAHGDSKAKVPTLKDYHVKGTVEGGTQSFDKDHGYLISSTSDPYVEIATREKDTPVYTFTPQTNYQLETVTIDGQKVTLDSDGKASGSTSEGKYEVETSAAGEIIVKFPEINQNRTVDVKFVYHNLVIKKSVVSPTTGAVKGGDTITYKITVTNSGSVTESNFQITDEIDTTRVKYKDTSPLGSYDDNTDTVTWSNLTLAPDKSLELLLEVEVLKTIEGEDKVSNSAGGLYPNNTPIPTAPAVDKNLLGRDITIKYHVSGATPKGGNQKPDDATEIYGNVMSDANKAAQKITPVDGYTFAGWYLNEDLTGNPFNPDAALNSTNYGVLGNSDTLDLYGKWTVNMDFSVEKIVTYKGSEIGPNDYIAPGSTVTYTIKVTNNNKFVDIPNVKVADTVPDNGLQIVETSISDEGKLESGVINWSVLVEAGKTKELTFNATVPSDLTVEKSYKNVVAVPSADGTTLTGVTDDVTFKAKPEDIVLSVVKEWSDTWGEHSKDTVYVQLYRKTSTQVDWEKVENAEFALTSNQPSASISTARYTDSGDKYEFMFRELDASGGNIIDEGGVINGYKASYSIDTTDENQTNILNTYIITKDDIEFTKTANSTAIPGEVLEYTLTVTNNRDYETATNIVVTDSLPEGVTLVAQDGLVCTPGKVETSNDTAVSSNNDRDITWTVEKLAPGDTAKLTIKVIVDAALTNVQIANEAKVTTVGETVYQPGEMPRASALTDVRVFEVNKVWSNTSAKHESVSVQLLQNNAEYGSPITLSDANNWTYKWTELPVYDTNKVRYVYNVKEVAVDGYSSVIDYSGDTNGNVAAKVTNTLKTYDITYEFVGTDVPGGITVPDSDTVDWGTKYDSADKPSHNDYVFDGWFTDKECTTPYVDGTVIDDTTTSGGGKVLYGKWTKKVEVSYEFVGDTPTNATLPDSEILVPGTAYDADSKTESIEDCTFEGWFTDVECTQKYVDGTQITKDTILYGKWTEKPEVRYTFVGDVPSGQTVPAGGFVPLGSPYDADKTTGSIQDYTFDGWYTDKECTQKYVDGTKINSDTILYGNWTHHPQVSYQFVGDVPNGQTVPNSERVVPGTSYNADSTTGSIQDYTFDGWYTDKECTQKYVDGTKINSDTVLYGKWSTNPVVSYEFVGDVPNGQTVPNSERVVPGTSYNADSTTGSIQDYTFDGWYTDKECTQKYVDGTKINSDTVLYGNWTHNPVVSYEFVGNVPSNKRVPASECVNPGTSYNADTTTKSDENYIFDGWYTDKECTQKYVDGTKINSDTVLYGKWSTNPVVSYEFVGETPSDVKVPASESVVPGTPYDSDKTTKSTKIYTFDGWYTDKECTQKYVDGTKINSDTVLYGKWTKVDGAVEYLPGAGKVPDGKDVVYPESAIYTVGEVVPVPPAPVYSGSEFSFGGWFTDESCTVPYVPTAVDQSGLKIYSKWIPNPVVSYTFVGAAPNGQKTPASAVVAMGAAYNSDKTTQSIPGYTFDGWYIDEACTTKYTDGTNINKDTVLYGKWTYNPKVIYNYVGIVPYGISVPGTEQLIPGTEYKSTSPDGSSKAYVFDGWYIDEACTQKYVEGTAIYTDTVLYGRWNTVTVRTGETQNNIMIFAALLLIAGAGYAGYRAVELKRRRREE